MEAFRKLRQLREELRGGLRLVQLAWRREYAKRVLLDIAEDQFNQAMHDLVDASGKPFEAPTLVKVGRAPVMRCAMRSAPFLRRHRSDVSSVATALLAVPVPAA